MIHAYCFQTFGTAGPDWYREGMAELLAMNATPRKGAVCRERNLDALGADNLALAHRGGGFVVQVVGPVATQAGFLCPSKPQSNSRLPRTSFQTDNK